MKSWNKRMILSLALLCLIICATSASANGQAIVEDYENIVNLYYRAMNADTVLEKLEYLRTLCDEYAEQAEALETYEGGTAWVYYTYARGMIAFEEKDYYTAWECFGDLADKQQSVSVIQDVPPLPDTAYYYLFSTAMCHWQLKEYDNACKALDAASKAQGASLVACKNALSEIGKELKTEAATCCALGNHSQAQNYYALYAQYVNAFEGKKMLSDCENHSPKIRGVATGTDSISVSWSGMTDTVLLSWTTDFSGTRKALSRSVQGNTAVLTGLFPGTEYLITVISTDLGITAQTTVSTDAITKKFSAGLEARTAEPVGVTRNETLLRLSSLTALTDRSDDSMAQYRCLKDDHTFTVREVTDYALYLRISYKNTIQEPIKASLLCIIRSETTGVYGTETEEETFAAGAYPSPRFISIDDLISEIRNDYHSIPKDTYHWEVYLDGMLFCEGDFSVQ